MRVVTWFAVAFVPITLMHADLITGTGNGDLRDVFDGTFGILFAASSNPIQVSRLGFIDVDDDGLLSSHRVGIWTDGGDTAAAGTLLASVTVQAGTASALDAGFRYESLASPILLAANTSYRLAA